MLRRAAADLGEPLGVDRQPDDFAGSISNSSGGGSMPLTIGHVRDLVAEVAEVHRERRLRRARDADEDDVGLVEPAADAVVVLDRELDRLDAPEVRRVERRPRARLHLRGRARDRRDRSSGGPGCRSSAPRAGRAPHRLAELGLDERVDDHRRPALRALDGELQVVDGLDARVAHLLERLVGELRLERSTSRVAVSPVASETMWSSTVGGACVTRGVVFSAHRVDSMRQSAVTMDKIVSLARRRGFVFPSSEIYGGLGSAYDYGHYGVLLKENVRARWLEAMVREREDIVALDSSIILHPRVWEASGHVEGFTDPLVDCRTCKQRYRADQLDEAQCGKRPSKKPGETSDCDLTEARHFNLMFKTRVGAVEETGSDAFLRPETAQGIFINFKNVAQLARRKPPFGIAQVGKSFRNEITPGNFIFRTLEFEQMEMEFFVPPDPRTSGTGTGSTSATRGTCATEFARATCAFARTTPTSSRTTRARRATSSTSSRSAGPSSRGSRTAATSTSRQHSEHSGTKLEWVDAGTGERFVPHVIEPALGLEPRACSRS